MRSGRRQGYSLTESMTVMAIILILTALLLPYLFRALRMAHHVADPDRSPAVQH